MFQSIYRLKRLVFSTVCHSYAIILWDFFEQKSKIFMKRYEISSTLVCIASGLCRTQVCQITFQEHLNVCCFVSHFCVCLHTSLFCIFIYFSLAPNSYFIIFHLQVNQAYSHKLLLSSLLFIYLCVSKSIFYIAILLRDCLR